MSKRLIICCDGTWQDSDGGKVEDPSNITRLARAIEPVSEDGTPQIVYYQSGVGNSTGVISSFLGGAFGEGLSEHVREAYGFLAHNYTPGDQVILVGFSRGAFTARSVGGLITKVGILTRRGMDQFYSVYNDYREFKLDQRAEELASQENGALVHKDSMNIAAIACFDTVGSLGIPTIGLFNWQDFNKKYQFHDTGLNLGKIDYAFHALALDENRGPFSPTMWEIPPKDQQNPNIKATHLRQCWFPGVHTNIGGGYPDQELADITLAWMIEMLQNVAHVIDFCKDYVGTIVKNDGNHVEGEYAEGKLENSAKGVFWLVSGVNRTPGEYKPKVEGSIFEEYIHPSVRARMQRMNADPKKKPGYPCKALVGWEVIEDSGRWKWVKKGKDGKTTELRETILGKMEKKIAGRRVIEKFFGPEAWDIPVDTNADDDEAAHQRAHANSNRKATKI